MYPELFTIPFTDLTIKSYGLMMVVGFLLAVSLIRRLSRNITPDPQFITNAALYSLVAGVVGARLFYVIHYFEQFKSAPLSVFAIWQGGLELLGGVVLAIIVIAAYLRYHKLPIRRYLDILAIALFVALAFGRIGCFLNGCCFGKPTEMPLAVRFPYGSHAYRNQISPDLKRNRPEPHLHLPDEFFGYFDDNGIRLYGLKPYGDLTPQQKEQVDKGPYRCLAVHPTQLYSSINAAMGCFLLYLFWRLTQSRMKKKMRFPKPGCTFALLFIYYGITRFIIEFFRDDNPFEFDGITISQNISIFMLVLGTALMFVFSLMKPPPPTVANSD